MGWCNRTSGCSRGRKASTKSSTAGARNASSQNHTKASGEPALVSGSAETLTSIPEVQVAAFDGRECETRHRGRRKGRSTLSRVGRHSPVTDPQLANGNSEGYESEWNRRSDYEDERKRPIGWWYR